MTSMNTIRGVDADFLIKTMLRGDPVGDGCIYGAGWKFGTSTRVAT